MNEDPRMFTHVECKHSAEDERLYGVYRALLYRYGPPLPDDVNDAFIRAGLLAKEMAYQTMLETNQRRRAAAAAEKPELPGPPWRRSVALWVALGALVACAVCAAVLGLRIVLR